MDAKKLVPFAIILVVLGGLVMLKSQNKQPESIVKQSKLESLVPEGTKAADIHGLKLYAAGKEDEAVALSREGEDWVVTSNFNAPAKTETVDEYLGKLIDIKGEPRAKNVSGDALGDYSLKDDEAFRVQALGKDGKPVVDLLVGKAADFRTIFLREPGGNTVYTESANLRSDAGVFGEDMTQAPTADKWLDKDILAVDQTTVERVAVTMPDKSLVFTREEKPTETPAAENEEDAATTPPPAPEYEWKLSEGGGGRSFKQAGLDKILTRLASLQAANIVDPANLAEYGLEAPAFRLEVGVADGDDLVLEAGRPTLTGNGYLRLASTEGTAVYEVSRYNLDQIFPKGSELFELPGIGATADALSRIEIAQPGGKVVLAKAGDAWQVESPAAALEVNESKLTAAAAALAAWTAADYADSADEAGPFDRTVTFTVNGAPRGIAVGANAQATDGVYVQLDGKPEVYVMSRTDAAKILLAPRDVYQLSAIDFDESAAQGIEATVAGKAISLTRAGDAWTVSSDAGTHPADTAAVDDLLSTLTEFQVSDFDASRSAADWSSELSVTVRLADGSTHGLNAGPAEAGLQPTQVLGMDTIFSSNSGVISRIASQLEALAAAPEPASEESAADAEDGAPAPEADAADPTPTPEADTTPMPVTLEATPAAGDAPGITIMEATPGTTTDNTIEVELPAAGN